MQEPTKATPQLHRVLLPTPDVPVFVFLSLCGLIALFGSLSEYMHVLRTPSRLCGSLFLLVCGLGAFGVEIYWLSRAPSIMVDRNAQTLSIRPFGPILRLDYINQIDVWREKHIGRSGIQISGPYCWRVYLVSIGGKQIQVWKGMSRDKARRLARELSEAARVPWIGGREAGQSH